MFNSQLFFPSSRNIQFVVQKMLKPKQRSDRVTVKSVGSNKCQNLSTYTGFKFSWHENTAMINASFLPPS